MQAVAPVKALAEPKVNPHLKLGGRWVGNAIYFVLIFNAVVVLLPLIWLISTSLKDQVELTQNIWGLPRDPKLKNYADAWTGGKISIYMLNSIMAAATAIVLSTAASTMIAYALSRFNFKLNRFFYYMVIAGMMIPIHAVVIPLYIIAMNLKMQNNLFFLGMIYGAFRIPISVLIVESFMLTIPKELEECAIIDGCSYYRIFLKIILPLSRDGIVTIAILTALACWNELLVSMLMLSKPFIKTLPIGLMGFITEWTSQYTILCAGLVIALVPNLVFYALMQEKIVKGMTVGAIKG
jgi:raffinose/stachyose/melibiose transport system permease protein